MNLRSETYLEHSRTPQMEFGTPLQDAMRRDLTINSLFYNLNTSLVEDFTEMGLKDLQSGTIRTPLPPLETFTDDPLRILRVIRFATRFRYQIHSDIYEAIKDPCIITSLDMKLSRERIGIEVFKMLGMENGADSLDLIYQFNCYGAVFKPSSTVVDSVGFELGITVARVMQNVLSNNSGLNDIAWFTRDFSPFRLQLFLACALAPFRNLFFGPKQVPLCKDIITNGLKLSNYYSDFSTVLVIYSDRIKEVVDQRQTSVEKDRLLIGKLITDLGKRPVNENWDLALLVSLAMEIQNNAQSKQVLIKKYAAFLELVAEYKLQHAYAIKNLLDGKQVAQHLNIKPGKQLGEIMKNMLDWQLETGTTDPKLAYGWLEAQSIH